MLLKGLFMRVQIDIWKKRQSLGLARRESPYQPFSCTRQVMQPLLSSVPGFKFILCLLFSPSPTRQTVLEPPGLQPGTVYMMMRKTSELAAFPQLTSGESTQTNIKVHSEHYYKGEFYCPQRAYNSDI